MLRSPGRPKANSVRICYLGNAGSAHVKKWATHFRDEGWEVHILSFTPGAIKGVRVHALPFSHLGKIYYFLAIPYIRRLVRQIAPDIVHAHCLTGYGGIAGRIDFDPVILSAWGSDVLIALQRKGMVGRLLRWFVSPSLKRAASITGESDLVRRALVERLSVEEGKVRIFAWGVDTEVFHPGYEGAQVYWRGELSIPKSHKVALSCRGILPVFNTEVIIRSIPHVVANFPQVTFVFFAGIKVQSYYARLRRIARRVGISERVRFIEKLLSPTEVAGLFNTSDVLVSIPRSDSLSISVMEGMACGAIPVCSSIEANLYLLREGGEIVLTVPEPRRLAGAILEVLQRRNSSWAAAVEKNCELVSRKFSWEQSCREMKTVYVDALGRGAPTGIAGGRLSKE